MFISDGMSPVLLMVIIVVLAILVAFVIAILRWRRTAMSEPTSPSFGPADARRPISSVSVALPFNVEAEVRDLLASGKKIEAIKLVRQYTGLGLKESKEYVEALSAGGSPAYALPEMAKVSQAMDLSSDIEAEVRDLLARGRKIEAIKLVRQHTGLGLKEAKDYVDGQPSSRASHKVARGDRVASLSSDAEAEVRDLLARGRKIEAIKLVRQHTGWGLREAKDYVDEQE